MRGLRSIADIAVVKKAVRRLIGQKRAIKRSVIGMVHRVREIKLLGFSSSSSSRSIGSSFIWVSLCLVAIVVLEPLRKVRVELRRHGLVKRVVVVSATTMAVKAMVVVVVVVVKRFTGNFMGIST